MNVSLNKFYTWSEYKDSTIMNAKLDAIIDYIIKETKAGNLAWDKSYRYYTKDKTYILHKERNYTSKFEWLITQYNYHLEINQQDSFQITKHQYNKLCKAIKVQLDGEELARKVDALVKQNLKVDKIFNNLKLELPKQEEVVKDKPYWELVAYKYATFVGFTALLASWLPIWLVVILGIGFVWKKQITKFIREAMEYDDSHGYSQ